VFGELAYVGNKKSLSRKLDTMKITICVVSHPCCYFIVVHAERH
jgi:hypothetical protein